MQFDLFDRPKGPATIIAFPLARRKGAVHDIALELARREYDQGKALWKAHVAEIRKAMKSAGIPAKIITAELERYGNEVARQVHILENYVCANPENAS